MNYFKLLGKSLLKGIIFLLISIFIITILNYNNIISGNLLSIILLIISIISIIISSYCLGKRTKQKQFIEGIKIGSIYIIIYLILSILVNNKFNFTNIIYYIILITSSIFGSLIGKNKKKN